MVEYSCWCLVVHRKILLTLLYEIFIQKTKILRRSFIIYRLYFLTVTNFINSVLGWVKEDMLSLKFFCLFPYILHTLSRPTLNLYFYMARTFCFLISIIKSSVHVCRLILKIENQSTFKILGSHVYYVLENQVVHLDVEEKDMQS